MRIHSILILVHKMLLVLVSAMPLMHSCYADPDSTEIQQTEQVVLNKTAPYCGIQAVCLAARTLGRDVDFKQMVKPQYIGSKDGSSLSELQSLCNDLHLKSKWFSFLTVHSLYGVTSPLILHTSAQADLKNYDHWTLFTGIKDDKAITWKVINGQSVCEAMALDDLATQWDGNALIVFSDYSTGVSFTVFVWAERIFLIGIITLMFLVLVNVRSAFQRYGKRINTCAGLCVMVFISSFVYFVHSQILYPKSFLVNGNVIEKIQKDHVIGFLPKITLNNVKKSHNDKNVIIVDARMEHQYQQGHIESSINIPYTMSLSEMDAVLKENPKDTIIIVVYESLGCTRAIDVFQRIKKLGFTNIYRFEDGWNKWEGETL